jgi:hypothetical protein
MYRGGGVPGKAATTPEAGERNKELIVVKTIIYNRFIK